MKRILKQIFLKVWELLVMTFTIERHNEDFLCDEMIEILEDRDNKRIYDEAIKELYNSDKEEVTITLKSGKQLTFVR